MRPWISAEVSQFSQIARLLFLLNNLWVFAMCNAFHRIGSYLPTREKSFVFFLSLCNAASDVRENQMRYKAPPPHFKILGELSTSIQGIFKWTLEDFR